MESQCPGLTPCYANPICEDKESVLRSANLYKEYYFRKTSVILYSLMKNVTQSTIDILVFYDKSKEDAESNGIGPLERSNTKSIIM